MRIGLYHNFSQPTVTLLLERFKSSIELQSCTTGGAGTIYSAQEFSSLKEALGPFEQVTKCLSQLLGGRCEVCLSLDGGKSFIKFEEYAIKLEEASLQQALATKPMLLGDLETGDHYLLEDEGTEWVVLFKPGIASVVSALLGVCNGSYSVQHHLANRQVLKRVG